MVKMENIQKFVKDNSMQLLILIGLALFLFNLNNKKTSRNVNQPSGYSSCMLEPFDGLNKNPKKSNNGGATSVTSCANGNCNIKNTGTDVAASEKLGHNEVFSAVDQSGRTPSSCYPQKVLSAEELLPKSDSGAITDFNQSHPIGEGVENGGNYLNAG